MLGTGLSAVTVVIILEFILAIYSGALAVNTERKGLKIVHIVLAVVWADLGILNIFF